MNYLYSLLTATINDAANDEIISLMMQQARISTRRRPSMWRLDATLSDASIRFRRKSDRDDFLEVFEAANDEFLERHGLTFVSHNTWPNLAKCATSSLMPVSAIKEVI